MVNVKQILEFYVLYRNCNLCSRAREGVDSFGGHGVTAAAT